MNPDDFTQLIGETNITLYGDIFPNFIGVLPPKMTIWHNTVTVFFLLSVIALFTFMLRRKKINNNNGYTTKEVREKINTADIKDIPTIVLKYNWRYSKLTFFLFTIISFIYIVVAGMGIINNHDQKEVYNGIDNTLSSSLENSQIKGEITTSTLVKLQDGTIIKYDIKHIGGTQYTIKIYGYDENKIRKIRQQSDVKSYN